MAEIERTVGRLKAAGETTRLRLLALLAEGEHSVKDLTEILGQSQPRISRHLKLLADAELVLRHAEGAWAYYRLAETGAAADLVRLVVEQTEADDVDRVRDFARLQAVQAAQQTRAAAYFASIAGSWDLQRRLHVAESAVEAAILAAVGTRKAQLLLDLGTGTGRMLELLAAHYHRAIGIDSSREMLSVARARLSAAGITTAQIRLGDIAALDGSVGLSDRIMLHQVLHYFDDPGRLLLQVRTLLRAGGEILVVDFAPHALEFLRTEHAHRRLGFSEAMMSGWARTAGLKVETVSVFPAETADGLTVCLWRLIDSAPEEAT